MKHTRHPRALTPAQQSAQDAARAAWAVSSRQSRVEGIADRIRCARNPKPINPAKRAAELELDRRRRDAAYRANKVSVPFHGDDTRYFPHQGVRECARRVRQAAV